MMNAMETREIRQKLTYGRTVSIPRRTTYFRQSTGMRHVRDCERVRFGIWG
ncbi:MAG: hypothetical protein ABF617_08185 [Gluconobacter japonicus]|uniref:hypothetical protein n=1 Tax=Gluconobacter japonicus TaxID=376620 RepID=UPI0039E9D5A9